MTANAVTMSIKEFHAAVWNIDVERVEKFIKDDPSLVNSRCLGSVPLISAIKRSKDMVVLLLDNGADPEGKDYQGWTSLQLLSTYCSPDQATIRKLLLDRGADIDAETPFGRTALSLAVCWGHRKIVEFLIKRGADMERTAKPLLSIAAREGRLEVIKVLLEHGANPNAKYKGMTASGFAKNKTTRSLLKYYEQYWKEICDFAKDPSLATFALVPYHTESYFSEGLLKKLYYFGKYKTEIEQYTNPKTKSFELFLKLREEHYDRTSFAKEFAECLLTKDIEFADAKTGMRQVLGYLRGGGTRTDAEVVYALFLRADMAYLAKKACSRAACTEKACLRVHDLCSEYLELRNEYFTKTLAR